VASCTTSAVTFPSQLNPVLPSGPTATWRPHSG